MRAPTKQGAMRQATAPAQQRRPASRATHPADNVLCLRKSFIAVITAGRPSANKVSSLHTPTYPRPSFHKHRNHATNPC